MSLSEHAKAFPISAAAARPPPAPVPTHGDEASRMPGFQLAGNMQTLRILGISARLEVSQPDDPEEREADRIADALVVSPPPPATIGRRRGTATALATAERFPRSHQANQLAPASSGNGQPLPDNLRTELEPRYGRDFSSVRIHTDAEAGSTARSIGAQAFTAGRDIFFAEGRYDATGGSGGSGRHLLAHELTHVVQQGAAGYRRLQRRPVDDSQPSATIVASPPGKAPDSPALLPGGQTYRVVVVGAPGAAEVNAMHPYQFADAAAAMGTDKATVWLVERTGYERGKVDLGGVLRRAGAARVFFIDESHTLASLLDQFPASSIGALHAFAHGTPGILALRHGWEGMSDYGLSVSEARSMSATAFSPTARISFDSCNSATIAGDTSLAEAVASTTRRPVEAWTGRTTYHDINALDATDKTVRGSEMARGWRPDLMEIFSQKALGRVPQRVTVEPGSWSGTFSIDARLPMTREFQVEGGRVDLTINAESEFASARGYTVFVLLHHSTGDSEDKTDSVRPFEIGKTAVLSWDGLAGGFYFFEIFSLNGIPLTGSVKVDVAPPPEPGSLAPGPASWKGTYSIKARLPRTREFAVAAGRIDLRIDAASDYAAAAGYAAFVVLHRRVEESDEEIGAAKRFEIGNSASFGWKGLARGTYFFEIFSLNGIPITGSIAVDVAASSPNAAPPPSPSAMLRDIQDEPGTASVPPSTMPSRPASKEKIQRQVTSDGTAVAVAAEETKADRVVPDPGALRAEAARLLVNQLQKKKAQYGHELVTRTAKGNSWDERKEGWWWEETEFDCAKFVLWVLAGRSIGQEVKDRDVGTVVAEPFGRVVDSSSVSAWIPVIDSLVKAGKAKPIHKDAPSVGDLILWTGHAGVVVEVQVDGDDTYIVIAHMGTSGAGEFGKSGAQYWLKVSAIEGNAKLARGTYLGFWTP